ncbi:hypothetical protein PAHAL_2G495400 [Panicum hallii]|uniref:Uncharacterized protein n=1 Tax=Panicum hallii TaxID=206008 RepID=A0A2T8KTI2_9POAL|nr:hypothetical protein PAHAL_2G495400 [Panicum hallii]
MSRTSYAHGHQPTRKGNDIRLILDPRTPNRQTQPSFQNQQRQLNPQNQSLNENPSSGPCPIDP